MQDNFDIGKLIPINESNGRRAVNARDLHIFLGNKRQFSDWIKQRISQYGFVENQDFEVFHNFVKNPNGGRPQDEYAISIDMAKELSMVENNERGRQARRYFIECENIATNPTPFNLPKDFPSALRELADTVEKNQQLALENKQKDDQIKKLKPKADFADAAFKADGLVDIGQAAKILGLPFGRNTLFKKLREACIFFVNKNEPKQKYIDQGYFVLTELPPIKRTNGPDLIVMKVYCTQKGLAYINHLFGGSLDTPSTTKIQ